MPRSLLLALLAPLTAISGGATEEDPLLSLLAGDDYGQSRPALAREIGRLGERRCGALSLYAGNRHERVRENAVRAMADAGCDRLEPYLPYLADPSPWVSEAFLRAAERHLLAGAVPWLLDHLEDRRRIVTGDGTWAIGEIALRALRLVACQPFRFDPRSAPEARAAAIEVWRDWYAAHRAEPRSAWLEAGIARAREQAGDGDPALRLEALRLLALLGPPAAPALRGALGRAAGDLRATLSCAPEEPPRVTDEIPCVLLISNRTDHRVGIAPSEGGPDVRLERLEEGRPVTARRPPPARAGPGRSRAARPGRSAGRPGSGGGPQARVPRRPGGRRGALPGARGPRRSRGAGLPAAARGVVDRPLRAVTTGPVRRGWRRAAGSSAARRATGRRDG